MNYIIAFYFGDRRRKFPVYEEDRLCYVKKQLEHLQTVPHSLSEITFVFSLDEGDQSLADEAFKLIPDEIQGAKCRVITRKNGGFSYGAWDEALDHVESDYYIFNEDDYFFIEPNWDTYLIENLKTQPNCGAFGIWINPEGVYDFPEHFCHSAFCTSREIVEKIKKEYGGFTYNSQKGDDYQEGQSNQHYFVQNIVKAGYRLYDIREDYRLDFAMTKPKKVYNEGDIWVHRLWYENDRPLIIPDVLAWDYGHRWWTSYDFHHQKNFREYHPHPNPA